MNNVAARNWENEFGLSRGGRYVTSSDLEDNGIEGFVHAGTLASAFKHLRLDGALLGDTGPLAFFKYQESEDPGQIAKLIRKFWNQGTAPVLVLNTSRCAQVLSGLSSPCGESYPSVIGKTRVCELHDRTQKREFLIQIESGYFFNHYKQYFDSSQRVDQVLLRNLRSTRSLFVKGVEDPDLIQKLDGILCRLIFAQYLFDRRVVGPSDLARIGISDCEDLLGILRLSPVARARESLLVLFEFLNRQFNGDIFGVNCRAEAKLLTVSRIKTAGRFFNSTDVDSGQQSIMKLYDFEVIPIETISAIYEAFLGERRTADSAYYTPKALSDFVLNSTLMGDELVGKKCLDPSCGSGVFLVGYFNRVAHQWILQNPIMAADSECRALALRKILTSCAYGVDKNLSACRVAAFSLYLAYLDKLQPPAIRGLSMPLPKLVCEGAGTSTEEAVIFHRDFFSELSGLPREFDYIIGNPPWKHSATRHGPVSEWIAKSGVSIPQGELAYAFMKRVLEFVRNGEGRVTLILPFGFLFHGDLTARFRREFFQSAVVRRVVNMADYQNVLFDGSATHPAVILTYSRGIPDRSHRIEHFAPRMDWTSVFAGVLSFPATDFRYVDQDSKVVSTESESEIGWKRLAWAMPLDLRLLERLDKMPRLRDRVLTFKNTGRSRRPEEALPPGKWLFAQGFKPFDPKSRRCPESSDSPLNLPTARFVSAKGASGHHLQLCLLEEDCESRYPDRRVRVHRGSVWTSRAFLAPLVIVNQGFSAIAYSDFDVSFQHALQGISGPRSDAELLMFLCGVLRSRLAKYYVFHSSACLGVYFSRVNSDELLAVPFPVPSMCLSASESKGVISQVAGIVREATRRSCGFGAPRESVAREAQEKIDPLVEAFYGLSGIEKALVRDTVEVVAPSFRPASRETVRPALEMSDGAQIQGYCEVLERKFNAWMRQSGVSVNVRFRIATDLGICAVVLERFRGKAPEFRTSTMELLEMASGAIGRGASLIGLARGTGVFSGDMIYLIKPLSRRNWLLSVAHNDADEIVGAIVSNARTLNSRNTP